MKIAAHTLVRNEENFIWYALNSVIDSVDKIKIGIDSRSVDKTEEIVKSIRSPKIDIKKYEISGPDDVSLVRQKMLDETDADWILILDGDEIWYEGMLDECKLKLINSSYEAVALPNYMLIGDVFHFQEEIAGKYDIAGRRGHLNLRLFKKTAGLHVTGIYPNEAYVNKDNILVQNLPSDKILFLDKQYLHASFLKRSSRDNWKVKYEIGEEFPMDFYYPEVFFKEQPNIVPYAFNTMNNNFRLNAIWQTPLKKIRRRVLSSQTKV